MSIPLRREGSAAVELAAGIGFTEGPLWTTNGRLLVTSTSRGAIYQVGLDGAPSGPVLEVGGMPTGLCQGPDETIWIVRGGSHREGARAEDREPGVFRWSSSLVRCGIDPLVAPNDCVIGPDERLWFTDPQGTPLEEEGLDGDVRVFDPVDGSTAVVAAGLRYPNGLAFDAAGTTLFVAETGRRRVLAFPVRGDALGSPDVFVDLPLGHPDGIALDRDGTMYVALSDGHDVAIVEGSGAVGLLGLPEGAFPTNVALGGADRRRLFITAASGGRVLQVSL